MDGEKMIAGTVLEAKSDQRVRINLKQSAKGDVQFDITSEFQNEAEAVLHLGLAIDKTKAMCTEKGLKLADAGAA